MATRTDRKTGSTEIPTKLGKTRKTAVEKTINPYGDFIWALARKFTASNEEAEAAAREILTDIWRFAERGENNQPVEKLLPSLIARKRLIHYLQ